jgi:hypothetical protein
MKKITFLVLALVTLSVTTYSCKDEGENDVISNDPQKEIDVDLSDFKGESLKKHGINALMMLPDETSNTGASVVPTFTRQEDHLWLIEMGPRFEMVIEDLGSETTAVERMKNELIDLGIYDIEFLVDEPDLIMYKRSIKYSDDSKLEVKKTSTYHCFGTKTIDGINYLIMSGKPDTGFHKLIVKDMVKTIRSFQALDQPA